ncbi:MAG: helix-turn-helix domain-containing protein [Burkholderiaceae bacterium]
MGHVGFEGTGAAVRAARESRRISQMELALRVGVSQRHLSYVENGKSMPSRELLHDLLESLDVPLSSRNALLMQAGYAPLYSEKPLNSSEMAPVKRALDALLAAHAPSPAMVMDRSWNLVAANQGVVKLVHAIGAQALLPQLAPGVNMLQLLTGEGPIRSAIVNFDEVAAELASRVRQEALEYPPLAELARSVEAALPKRRHLSHLAPKPVAPVIATRLRSAQGELAFFSMFTTFGAPLDITAASLRVEHMFAADEFTQQVVRGWGESK